MRALLEDQEIIDFTPPGFDTILEPHAAFSLALSIARLGCGFVSPNPPVGAVIVDAEHRFLAAGAHRKFGAAHAEIDAINQLEKQGLADRLRDATLYVTLEPCTIDGKTPPCVERLTPLPLRRVVYGCQDPNPNVRGAGIEALKQAGIDCVYFEELAEEAEALIEVFSCNQTANRSFVGLKAAATLDGAIARTGDKRVWITGERARHYGHYLRLKYDAVAIGRETLQHDNPALTFRRADMQGRNPIRVVFDPEMSTFDETTPRRQNIIGDDPDRVLWLVDDSLSRSQRLAPLLEMGVQIISLPRVNGAFNPQEVLQALWRRNVGSLLLEGGVGLYTSFLQSKLVDRMHLFQAPMIYGKTATIRWQEALPDDGLIELRRPKLLSLDRDWLVEGRLT